MPRGEQYPFGLKTREDESSAEKEFKESEMRYRVSPSSLTESFVVFTPRAYCSADKAN